jgi:hypothetical protein
MYPYKRTQTKIRFPEISARYYCWLHVFFLLQEKNNHSSLMHIANEEEKRDGRNLREDCFRKQTLENVVLKG